MRRARWTLPALLLGLLALGSAGCKEAYRSTDEVTLDSHDIVYLKDDRTNLCFAVVAMQNPLGTKIRHVSMVSVPCEALAGVETR